MGFPLFRCVGDVEATFVLLSPNWSGTIVFRLLFNKL